jgi:hypothetical protein
VTGAIVFTVVPKLFSLWRYRRRGNGPACEENEMSRLIQQHAPGVLSAAELAKLKQFTNKNAVGHESTVVIRGADLKKLAASGSLDEREQVLEFLDSNSTKADGVEVKLDAEGKPAQVLLNGQLIDLRDHLR